MVNVELEDTGLAFLGPTYHHLLVLFKDLAGHHLVLQGAIYEVGFCTSNFCISSIDLRWQLWKRNQ